MASKRELQDSIKSSGTAYALYWFFGAQYGYQGKWGTQLLYWFTLGGLGVWMLIDLFRIGGMIKRYNAKIYEQIEELEEQKQDRHLEKLAALRN
jgi:hypothetical protein